MDTSPNNLHEAELPPLNDRIKVAARYLGGIVFLLLIGPFMRFMDDASEGGNRLLTEMIATWDLFPKEPGMTGIVYIKILAIIICGYYAFDALRTGRGVARKHQEKGGNVGQA
jgi:hypothetical protein